MDARDPDYWRDLLLGLPVAGAALYVLAALYRAVVFLVWGWWH